MYRYISLLLWTSFLASCNSKTIDINSFEEHLIPAIQVENELRFYHLKDRMEHYKVPGISIVIVKKGEIAFSKGYGLSRTDDSIKVSTKTVFQAGSIAKSITAVGVIRLVEKGVLDLDKNIEEYLINWKFPQNPYTKTNPITLRMLLSHTSGMIHNNYKGFRQNEDLPSLNAVLNGIGKYKPAQLDTIPGVRYYYSNTGYGVIQRIVEDVVGKPFEEIMKEEVFIPFKMSNSTFKRKTHNDSKDISYAYNRKGAIVEGYWYNAGIKASGGLWTTAEDLAKFMIHMQKDFSKEKRIEMLTPVKANYGIGFNIKGEKDALVFYHSGKNVGYTNLMIGYAKQGDGVVILTNGDNGGYLFSEIIRGISEINQWKLLAPKVLKTVEVEAAILDTYLGTYRLKISGEVYTLRIEREGPHLVLVDLDENNEKYPLRALSKTKFRDINDGEKVSFVKGKDGKIVLLWDEEYRFIREESTKGN